MKPFIITGCARSGTAYTSRLLTAAGVPCTHEEVFSLEVAETVSADGWRAACRRWRKPGDWADPDSDSPAPPAKGESSWLAAPLLDQLPKDILVFHQLRNPLHVIRSLMRRRFFHPNRGTGSDYAKYARRQMKREVFSQDWNTIEDADSPLVQCMKYWVRWTQFTSHRIWIGPSLVRGFCYRVEDLSEDQLFFPRMLRAITGSWVPSSPDLFERVPVGVNHRSVEMDAGADVISWSDLPEIPTKRTLEQMASSWYGKEELK